MPNPLRLSRPVTVTRAQAQRIARLPANTNKPITGRLPMPDWFVHPKPAGAPPAPLRTPFVKYVSRRFPMPQRPVSWVAQRVYLPIAAWDALNFVWSWWDRPIGAGNLTRSQFNSAVWQMVDGPHSYGSPYNSPAFIPWRWSTLDWEGPITGQAGLGDETTNLPGSISAAQNVYGLWIRRSSGVILNRYAHYASFARIAAGVSQAWTTFPRLAPSTALNPYSPVWQAAVQAPGRWQAPAELIRALPSMTPEPIPSPPQPYVPPNGWPHPSIVWRPMVGGGLAPTYRVVQDITGGVGVGPHGSTGGAPLPSPRIIPPSVRPRRPPARGQKDKKVRSTVQKGLAMMDLVSESSEIVDAFYDALPARVRYNAAKQRWREGKKNPALLDQAGQYGIDGANWKAGVIFKHFDDIDPEKAVENLVKNAVQDRVVGGIHRGLPRNTGSVTSGGVKQIDSDINDLWTSIGF